MPIDCSETIVRKTQKEFHELDEIIIGHVFDIHNEFGRFGDERIYSNKLKFSLATVGIDCKQEVYVKVSYKDFIKVYFLDLLVMKGVIYELKAVKALTESHCQQLINYLLLTDLNHGHLVNFRQPSVEKRFVSTKLNFELRQNYMLNTNCWDNSLAQSSAVKNILVEVLKNWGAFLDYHLYKDAIIYFLGGKQNVLKNVNVFDGNKVLGQQKFILLNATTAFYVSGVSSGISLYEKHLMRLLKHVELDCIQWIKFDKSNITLKTIRKSSC